jgi:hypothetical protein
MNLREVYEYYSRDDVNDALLSLAKGREVVGVFRNGSFDTRPNVLITPNDILVMARSGAVEFHCSLERWSNVMSLKSDNYENLRTGWDIVLDLDCKEMEHGKVAARVLIDALKKHGVRHFSLKFTGNRGFHLGLPWESMPRKLNYKPTPAMYPDLARRVAAYLREEITDDLEKALLKNWGPEKLAEATGKPLGSLFTGKDQYRLDPFQVVEIDPILISPRHLFRMPYSLNAKTFLVSLPIEPSKLEDFKKTDAEPSKIKAKPGFLAEGEKEELALLVAEAFDWSGRKEKKEKRAEARRYVLTRAVPKELFPPCIKHVLQGLSDGRKRSVFILINFLHSMKWSYEDIEKLVFEWNTKNQPPLKEAYMRGQLNHFHRRGQAALPPNCENQAYIPSFGACRPDEICKGGSQSITLKNPASYPIKAMRKKRRK